MELVVVVWWYGGVVAGGLSWDDHFENFGVGSDIVGMIIHIKFCVNLFGGFRVPIPK